MVSAGLSIRECDSYVIATLRGELDVSDAASVAGALTAVAARNPRIIVDLAALAFIDCCALGELSRVRAEARQAGGDLLLAAPGGQVRRILTITGMTGVFPVCASLAEAVRIAGCSRALALAPARRPPPPAPGAPAIPGTRVAAMSSPGGITQPAAHATEQPVTPSS